MSLARLSRLAPANLERPFTRLAPATEPEIDAVTGRATFIFNTEDVGRDGHIVRNAGIRTENYETNPVILFAHDDKAPPIGRSTAVRIGSPASKIEIEFTPRDVYPFGATIGELVKARYLNACSMSWQPIKWHFRSAKEGIGGGVVFDETDMLEVSIVPVPALPEAVATARAHGIDTRPLYEWAERLLDTGGGSMPRRELESLRSAAKMAQRSHDDPTEEREVYCADPDEAEPHEGHGEVDRCDLPEDVKSLRSIERAAGGLKERFKEKVKAITDARTDKRHPADNLSAKEKARREIAEEDHGYKFADTKNKKYGLNNAEEIRASWNYIHMPKNQKGYTAAELKTIEGRIVSAWKEKIDPKGPPSAEGRSATRRLSRSDLPAARRGLYHVAQLAYCLQQIGYLHDAEIVEAELEEDGSKVPGMMLSALEQLVEVFKADAAEEAEELLAEAQKSHGDEDDLSDAERSHVAGAVTARGRVVRRAFALARAGRALSKSNADKLEEADGHTERALKHHKAMAESHDALGAQIDAAQEAHERASSTLEELGEHVRAAKENPAEAGAHIERASRSHRAASEHMGAIAECHDRAEEAHEDVEDAHHAMGRSVKRAQRCMRAVLSGAITSEGDDSDAEDVENKEAAKAEKARAARAARAREIAKRNREPITLD